MQTFKRPAYSLNSSECSFCISISEITVTITETLWILKITEILSKSEIKTSLTHETFAITTNARMM